MKGLGGIRSFSEGLNCLRTQKQTKSAQPPFHRLFSKKTCKLTEIHKHTVELPSRLCKLDKASPLFLSLCIQSDNSTAY